MKKNTTYKLSCLLTALIFCLFAGCTSDVKKMPGKKLIVCTTGYVADLVKMLAGDEAQVITLMGPGVDPHLYKPGLGDIDYLTEADLIVYNGLHLEGKMTGILEKIGATRNVIALSDGLAHENILQLPGVVTVHDPHFWFDASLWKKAGEYFAARYAKLGWNKTDDLNNRTNSFQAGMDELHLYAANKIGAIPESRRYLVTAHDAFGYFSRAYGIKVKALQGISTQSEYGLKDITELQNFLIEKNIPAIFVESSVPKKSVDAIVEGCKSKGFKVVIGGELYSDALGTAGSPEGTYAGVFRHNVDLIAKGLAQPSN